MLPKKLQKKLDARKEAQSFRQLPGSNATVDFASNDYLGFSRSTRIAVKTSEILRSKDILANGATGSRLLSGNHKLYESCEGVIAQFHESETALIFNSGYDANLGFFQSVPQRGDILLFDTYIHASIRDGIRMCNANSYKFKHNDLNDLAKQLEKHQAVKEKATDQTVYVITESVFSMDGDSPDVQRLVALCQKYNALLVIDEAHALGVSGSYGQGMIQTLKLHDQVFARIVTFGKGMGAHGAAILASAALRDYLINFARSFIYTTALPPHSVANIMAAYETLVAAAPLSKLQENIQFFKEQLSEFDIQSYFIPSISAIHCAIIPGNDRVKVLADTLNAAGFDVKPILSPTVAKGEERLRFCLHAFNSFEEIKSVLSLMSRSLAHEISS